MDKYIMITTTFDNKEEANKIIEILLEKRLVSCCQLSNITSSYHWKGKIEHTEELLLQMKSKKELFKEIEKVILDNHSYETPQLIAYDIVDGYKGYLDWIGNKIMKLYVIRHGQTNWNLKGIIQGQKDIELNDKGINEARKAKDEFNSLKIDLIMCSPLKRAKETAKILNTDKNINIIYKSELIERGLGDFEGKSCITEEDDIYNYHMNKTIRNIEPVVDLCNRVNELIDEIKNKYKGKNILLVTHSGTARAIERYFYGIDENGDLPPENLKNCEIREYEIMEK